MNLNLSTEFFLARRYLRPKRNAVSVITCISVVGVTLGVAVLIVVLAVMTGFTDLMKDKLLETRAHLHVYSRYGSNITRPEDVITVLKEEGVRGAAVVNYPVLLQIGGQFIPKNIFGVRRSDIEKQMNIDQVIEDGKFSLGPGEVVISTQIANDLRMRVGDKLLIHAPGRLADLVKVKQDGGVELTQPEQVYLPDEFRITGCYSFGKYDFDKNIIFVGLEDADELFGLPWGAANVIYGWTDDPFSVEKIAAGLKKKLPLMQIMTWKQLNQQLLGVLNVEKNMMFFLLVFIVLVAAFSITNTLITVVYQKTREIGLLKALGASSAMVMRIFILQGLLVGIIGSVCGTLLGSAVVYWRNDLMGIVAKITGQPLFPKEFYYFNELPAHIVTGDIIFIVTTSILLCTLGGIIPAWRAAKLDPAKALRYE